MNNWLYLDMNSFFASCEQQANPLLRGKPVAVVPMKTDSTCCLAASYEAKAFGIKTGTPVSEAKKICPGLQLVQAHHDLYVRYHHAVITAVNQCVPVHSVCSIDEICSELTGSQKNESVAIALAKKIKQTLRLELGESLTASIGIGPNILLAKVAADMKKPDGLTILRKEELLSQLEKLQLKDIPGIGRRMEARLHQAGVLSMRSLLALNEMQMRGIWGGINGARYYQLLKGEQIDLHRSFSRGDQQKSISHQHVLPPEQRNREQAFFVLQKLLAKAAIRLRRAGVMTRHMGIYIKYLDGRSFENAIRFHETQDTSFLLKRLGEIYQAAPKTKPIKVAVVISHFAEKGEHQLSFFESDRGNNLFQIVDEINVKYGRDTVYVGSLHEHREAAPTRIAFSRIPELDEL